MTATRGIITHGSEQRKHPMNYPTGFKDKTVQMLFDIGYSYGLLARTRVLLILLRGVSDQMPPECQKLIDDISDFEIGRLSLVTDIYEQGAQAAQYGSSPAPSQHLDQRGDYLDRGVTDEHSY
jgi:hypothetical protein